MSSATLVEAGVFQPPSARVGAAGAADRGVFGALPRFCRVEIAIAPHPQSDIRVEVWLPAEGWNGRFQGVGNRGWGGAINYDLLAAGVRNGFAAASTDTGHRGAGSSFAVGQPEKVVDAGHRAVHEMTVAAKRVVAAYYGRAAAYSYWNGCSLGGRQGLAEAQRYPEDYDGIIAGDPANNLTALYTARLLLARTTHRSSGSYIPPEKYPVIHRAVLAACDRLDGVADGVLDDPRRCQFDPATLRCGGENARADADADADAGAGAGVGPDADADAEVDVRAADAGVKADADLGADSGADSDALTCLTADQVETARALYADVHHPHTGALLSSGLPAGTEPRWSAVAGPAPENNALGLFRDVVLNDPQWDWQAADITTAIDRVSREAGPILDAVNPDLTRFFERGGKLLLYHGWADPQTPAGNTTRYYDAVRTTVGPTRADRGLRLFMIPGMGHCAGPDDVVDPLPALQQWVERGNPPPRLEAPLLRSGQRLRTRLLCPYPATARWNGTGDPTRADSFTCQTAP